MSEARPIGLFEAIYTTRALRRLRPDPLPRDRWEQPWPFAEQQPDEGWQRRWVGAQAEAT